MVFILLLTDLLGLVFTPPVSTTIEWVVSTMKMIKTRLHNKIEDDFLIDYMVVYIEREIAENFTLDMIIDNFMQ